MAQNPGGEPLTISPRSTILRRANCARFLHRMPPERSGKRSSSVSWSLSCRPTVAITSVAAAVPPDSAIASKIGRQYLICGRSEPLGALTGAPLDSDSLDVHPEAASTPGGLPLSPTLTAAKSASLDGSSPNMRRNTVFGVSTKGSACALRSAYTSSSRTTSGAILVLHSMACNYCKRHHWDHNILRRRAFQTEDIEAAHCSSRPSVIHRLQA